MPLNIVDHEGDTINGFFKYLRKTGLGVIYSLQDSQIKRKKTITVGTIDKVIGAGKGREYLTILVREVLPDLECGQIFKAVIRGDLVLELINSRLAPGDKIAFLKPFILVNTTFYCIGEDREPPKYLLEIGGVKPSLMWLAKNQDRITVEKTTSSVTMPRVKNAAYLRNNDQNKEVKDSLKKIPLNTQPLNPQYKYQKLDVIKSNALRLIKDPNDCEIIQKNMKTLKDVNMYAVVRKIRKELEMTSNNKFTIICELVDESMEGNTKMDLHFFVPENTILKKIESGDILRLHRVKVEYFNEDVDGRVFFNNSIVLFKKDSSDIEPITTAKNFNFTDEDKNRIKELKQWYKDEFLPKMRLINKNTLLAEIHKEAEYSVICKVVKEPKWDGNSLILQVTDGSVITGLLPALPIKRYRNKGACLDKVVTRITVYKNQKAFAELKDGDFVSIHKVKAVKLDGLCLVINSPTNYQIIDNDDIQTLDIKRRLGEPVVKNTNSDDEVELTEEKHPEFTPPATDHDPCLNQQPEVVIGNSSRTQKNRQLRSEANSLAGTETCPLLSNKSCIKRGVTESKRGSKMTDQEGRSSTEHGEVKSRKILFTANYGALSDATDDVSEVLETSQLHEAPSPNKVVVPPANTSFSEVMVMMRDMYCSQRNLSSPHHTMNTTGQSTKNNDKMHENTDSILMLESKDKTCPRNLRSTKRACNEIEIDKLEEFEKTSTIVNDQLEEEHEPEIIYEKGRIKRTRLDSTKLGEREVPAKPIVDEISNIKEGPENGKDKVSSWLFHPENQINSKPEEEDARAGELELDDVKRLLFGSSEELPDMSSYLQKKGMRARLFLLDVWPNPSMDALDLVSGYCVNGCKKLILFSKIHWHITDENRIPFCPFCIKLQLERELELMFMLELHVMDTKGCHETVICCREYAEKFLRCAVKDFVQSEEVRMSRTQMLTEFALTSRAASNNSITPMLDATVHLVGRQFCLIDTVLKLPLGL